MMPNHHGRFPGGTCQVCGADRVYHSRRRGAMEGFLYLGGWRMRRCHECDFRFAQIGCSPVHLSDLRRLARRAVFAIVAMAAIAAMATMLAAVIWLGPHPANGPGHAATSSAPAQRAEGFT